jgi:predicted PurR-regulated permease PerM
MTDARHWQLLILTVLLGGLLYVLAPVLTPFAVSALLAYLGDPLVDRLEKRKLSRGLAVSVVFALMTLAMVGFVLMLVPMIERQIGKLVEQLPRYVAWLQETALPWIETQTGFDIETFEAGQLTDMLKQHWQQAGGIAATVLGGISKSGLTILLWLTNLALIPVVTFYLLRDWDILVGRVGELLPRMLEPTITRLAKQSDEVLGAFLRGQVSVMLALGAIYSVGLWLVGIDLALLIGMLAGLVSFIPYLGAIVGIGAGLIAALVQYGDITHVVLVLAVFAVGQTLESFVLTPWLVGDRIGLHPVAVIFAIMVGGQLFGFLGILMALPVAAVVMVLLRYAHERYTESELYRAPDDGLFASRAGAVPVRTGDAPFGAVAAASSEQPAARTPEAAPVPAATMASTPDADASMAADGAASSEAAEVGPAAQASADPQTAPAKRKPRRRGPRKPRSDKA